MPSGDFSCAQLQVIKVKAEQIWADSTVNVDYIAEVEAAKALLTEQTAQIGPLLSVNENTTDPKDTDVTIQWIDTCGVTTQDATNACTIDGIEPQGTCKNYTMTILKETNGLKIKEDTFRTSTFSRSEVVARAMIKHLNSLDELIAQTIVAKIDSFAGANAYTAGIGNVVGNDTFISASHWTANIFAYFAMVMRKNKLQNNYLLSGDNLWQQSWIAAMNQTPEKSPDAMKMRTIRTYHDLFNVDSVLGTPKTFMINKSAVAFASRTYYTSTPIEYNGIGQTRFTIPSNNLPGVSYDVIYTTKCDGGAAGGASAISHHWKFNAKYDVFLNPESDCVAGRTGVLSFTCGEAPPAP